ncbi:MAG: glycosyl hydrolase [Bryobacteraceae bacterium]
MRNPGAGWVLVLLTGVVSTRALCRQADTFTLNIDASRSIGLIRPLQDLDNGPLCQRGIIDLSRYYKELGVRNIRLHDVPWTYDNAFDINYIFPKWDAAADDPGNYDFRQTDFYLRSITSLGVNVIYRLGYSAEYKTAVHHNVPPSSYQKFADICAHAVQHHNRGWANGERAGIKYWEIWNEPDGHSFWAGTPEEFDRLYETVARTLKHLDPSLKVGGPALAGQLEFLDQFLNYCRQRQVPLDFVSWHIYTRDAHEVARRAREVHEMMTQYGFSHAESILDEWNYGPANWKKLFVDPQASREYFDATQNSFGAAFDATVLMDLQDAPVDIATFYSGTTLMWGLFTSSGAPQKPYYAFLAFRRLLDSPHRVTIDRPSDGAVTALAGLSDDEETLRVLISNLSSEKHSVRIDLHGFRSKGPLEYQKQVVSNHYDLEPAPSARTIASSLTETLDGQSVSLLTFRSRSSGGITKQ